MDRFRIYGSGNSAGALKLNLGHLMLGTGSGFINWPSTGHLYFRTLSNPDDITSFKNRMVILNNGQVGIGTISIENDAKFKIYDSQFPMLRIACPYNGREAGISLTVAAGDTYYSNSALAGDAIISTHFGTTRNLLIQNTQAGQQIKFVTNYNNYQGVKMTINDDGKVGIGTSNFAGNYLLYVGGKVICEEIRVKLQANWPDFVFNKSHSLMPLDSVKTYIEENHHLPNVPSAQEVKDNGIETGEMFRIQMQKIEELTLYILELKKQYDEVKIENIELTKRIEELEKQ